MTPHSTVAFMQQCARQLTDPFDGLLLGKRYLLHDRDIKLTRAFDGLLKDSGVKPIALLLRSPYLNAHCERFVHSIKEEILNHMVVYFPSWGGLRLNTTCVIIPEPRM
jgi:putative transposase